MKYPLLFLFTFCLTFQAHTQNTDILEGLTGNQLLAELKIQYKPSVVLPYDQARDTMFGVVDIDGDSLECIYSGHKVHIPAGADPTTAAYQNGSNNGINTEHTYPQSMWSGGNSPKSDMHHLFPTRAQVNNARSSDPFADINDNFVDTWYYKSNALSSTPSSNIDLYSEDTNQYFEPRESVKGDIARAMFYFYTMYNNEANAVSSSYFQNQLPTLCEWHDNDPADYKETLRTWKISNYQEYKPNPFILDCTLADRANYCSGISTYCTIISSNKNTLLESGTSIVPNPARGFVRISFSDVLDISEAEINIYDVSGKLLHSVQTNGGNGLEINLEDLPKGVILFKINSKEGTVTKKIIHQ